MQPGNLCLLRFQEGLQRREAWLSSRSEIISVLLQSSTHLYMYLSSPPLPILLPPSLLFLSLPTTLTLFLPLPPFPLVFLLLILIHLFSFPPPQSVCWLLRTLSLKWTVLISFLPMPLPPSLPPRFRPPRTFQPLSCPLQWPPSWPPWQWVALPSTSLPLPHRWLLGVSVLPPFPPPLSLPLSPFSLSPWPPSSANALHADPTSS